MGTACGPIAAAVAPLPSDSGQFTIRPGSLPLSFCVAKVRSSVADSARDQRRTSRIAPLNEQPQLSSPIFPMTPPRLNGPGEFGGGPWLNPEATCTPFTYSRSVPASKVEAT